MKEERGGLWENKNKNGAAVEISLKFNEEDALQKSFMGGLFGRSVDDVTWDSLDP